MWEPARDRGESPQRNLEKPLTARTVESLRPTGRVRRIRDVGHVGLYLRIGTSGTKSWVLRTVVHGKRCDIGLGGVSLVSLAEAREEAHRLRKIARAGHDPLAERRQRRHPLPTFEEAAKQVHAAHAASFRNAKHRKQWLSSLNGVFASFGAKRVDNITSGDVLAALDRCWLSRPETSRRILQRLRIIFDWAKARGFCSSGNPTDGVTKVLPKHRRMASHHAALPYGEVPSFLAAVRTARADEVVRLAFEFLILTAARTNEVLGARWEEIDRASQTWAVPATRIKAGREHRVPLSSRCIELLDRAQGLADGSFYVFHGRSAKRPLSNMVFLMTLRRMGRTDITAHGFRSSFRDWAAERTNFPRAVCEAALAHTLRDKTEAAYHRTDLFERRRDLMAAWSDFVTSAVSARA